MNYYTNIRLFPGMLACLWLAGCLRSGSGGHSSPPIPVPTASISVSPSAIAAGQPATLTWSSTNASTCTASDAWTGSQGSFGSLNVSPPVPGTYTYTLSCSGSGSSAAIVSTTLSVASAPLSLAITTASLANGVVGMAYSGTIQGTGGVAPYSWTVSSGALPGGLALGTSTTNTVTLSGMPQAGAVGVAFTVEVTDSAQHVASQPYTVSILAQGDGLVMSPSSLEFGAEIVGSAGGKLTETLTNTAIAPVAFNGIAITGSNAAEFNQTSTCGAALAAGESCAIDVTFTPVQTGPRSAALTITDDTAGSPHSLSLSGTGVTAAGPNATLSVSGLNLGTQLVGTTSPALPVTLTNYGTGPLSVSQVTAAASFAETDNCVPGLPPGSSCTISVTFTPGASGLVTGTLSISDDAPGSPQTVQLSGTGSTNTGVLTGYCVGVVYSLGPCRIFRTTSSACPGLHLAQHPVTEHLCGTTTETVDGARSCSGYGGSGKCATAPF